MKTLINNIVSLEEEKLVLSDFLDNTLIMFIVELYQKCKGLKNRQHDSYFIQNQYLELIQNQQNYLSMINPEIIIISDQYSQLNSLTSSFENIVNNIPSELKQSEEFLSKKQLILNNIQKGKKYFKPFDCLYNKHLQIFKALVDFDALEIKLHINNLLASIIGKSENNFDDISFVTFVNYIENIRKGKVSLEQLQKDSFYKKLKLYIQYFNENKEALKEKVFNAYMSENNINNYQKTDMLQNLHKYHANDLNELYNDKCAHIPQIKVVQTNLRNLEEMIHDFSDYYSYHDSYVS